LKFFDFDPRNDNNDKNDNNDGVATYCIVLFCVGTGTRTGTVPHTEWYVLYCTVLIVAIGLIYKEMYVYDYCRQVFLNIYF
jgi:hypothetical protein